MMNPKVDVTFEAPFPESLSADALSIAVIGPDVKLRKAVVTALAGCHSGNVNEFTSYPPGLDDLPRLLSQRHDIIMIEWDANPEYALDLVEGICANGRATVMVYSKETDLDLTDPDLLMRCMRAGAREFLGMPFTEGSMAEALVRAAARRPPTPVAKKAGGRLLVFCGAKGGAGVTAIACNFAMALAKESSQSTLLIDLNIPLGDVAINLGIVPEYSTIDALQNASRLDASFLSRLLVAHNSGLSVLAAPGNHSTYRVTEDAIEKLMTVARQSFENVVVDAGSKLELTGNADVFRSASTIYLVTQAGIPELRNANRLISQYFQADTPKVEIVLNRYDTRNARISEDDIKKALTRPAKWRIPNDYAAVRRMQDTAQPVVFTDSFISRQLAQMARAVCGLPELPEKKKGFSFKSIAKGFSAKGSSDDMLSISPTQSGIDTFGSEKDAEEIDSGAENGESSNYLDFTRDVQTCASEPIIEPQTRTYNGNVYSKGLDGLWRIDAQASLAAKAEPPIVTWSTPKPIVYENPINGQHFNASSSVPGTFSYTPAAGYVLPVGTHTLWATFTPHGPNAVNIVQESVTLTVTKATPVIKWDLPAAITCGTPLSELQLNAACSVPGTLEYSPAAGAVLAEGRQTLLVSFTPNDLENYEGALAETSIVVVKERPKITWLEPTPISYGTALSVEQLRAASPLPGTFTYSPAEGTILAAGAHTLKAVFTPADLTNYTLAEMEVPLIVAKARPTITWPVPAPISYGTPMSAEQLKAVASIPGTFNYIPGEGAVLGAGKHKPMATFTPVDTANYTNAHTSVSLTVAKATPIISWPNPADIRYGTPIGQDQLNAAASVPGTFTYKPESGEVLAEGVQRLTAIFTPVDTTNYTIVEAAAMLTVGEAAPVTITWPDPEDITYGALLGASQLNASASLAGSFKYDPPEATKLVAGIHTISVIFTPEDQNISAAQASVDITVHPAQPVISWAAPKSIPYGSGLGPDQLNAISSVHGSFLYNPPATTRLPGGKHVLSVSFIPEDTLNYTQASAEVPLTVTKGTPLVVWPEPAAIMYGTVLGPDQLNAEASLPGTLVYSPAAGTVLTAGLQMLSVTFIPEDELNYAKGQAKVCITVNEFDDIAPLIGQLSGTEKADAPVAQASGINLVSSKRFTESKPEQPTAAVPGRPLELVGTPNLQIASSEKSSNKSPKSINGSAAKPQGEVETRFYRGQTYRKGADGQWHLQQN